MTTIGPYQVLEELGRGAMGVVFRGFDPTIGRQVAIKLIRASFATEEEIEFLRQRLAREAAAGGRLSHAAIVTVYHIGQHEGTPYLVMEFVDGCSLESMLKQRSGQMEPEECIKILGQVADGLDHAHSQGVVHRDVKPANILVRNDGQVKIADFGIARIVDHNMTRTGYTMGTLNYMAPEQIAASSVSGRADQYALAVIAFEMLCGRKPFESETHAGLILKITSEGSPSLHEFNPKLSAAANAVIQRALAKEPVTRFGSCAEFVQALADGLASTEVPVAVAAPVAASPAAGTQMTAGRPVTPVAVPEVVAEVAPVVAASRRSAMLWAGGAVAAVAVGVGAWSSLGDKTVAKKEEKKDTVEKAEPLPSVPVGAGNAAQLKPWRILKAGADGQGPMKSPAFSKDGTLVAACDDQQVYAWELPSGRLLRSWKAGSSACCTFNGDSLLVADGARLACYDVKNNRAIFNKTSERGGSACTSVFSPDGRRVARRFQAANEPVQLVNAATGELIRNLEGFGRDSQVQRVYSPDSGKLAYFRDASNLVLLVNAQQGQPIGEIRTGGAVQSLYFSADGSRFVTVSQNPRQPGVLETWQTASLACVARLSIGNSNAAGHTLAISPDLRLLASAAVDGEKAEVRELASGRVRHKLAQPAGDVRFWSLQFSPDNSLLLNVPGVVTDPGNPVRPLQVWSAGDGKLQFTGEAAQGAMVSFSGDKAMIATAGMDGQVRVLAVG